MGPSLQAKSTQQLGGGRQLPQDTSVSDANPAAKPTRLNEHNHQREPAVFLYSGPGLHSPQFRNPVLIRLRDFSIYLWGFFLEVSVTISLHRADTLDCGSKKPFDAFHEFPQCP